MKNLCLYYSKYGSQIKVTAYVTGDQTHSIWSKFRNLLFNYEAITYDKHGREKFEYISNSDSHVIATFNTTIKNLEKAFYNSVYFKVLFDTASDLLPDGDHEKANDAAKQYAKNQMEKMLLEDSSID